MIFFEKEKRFTDFTNFFALLFPSLEPNVNQIDFLIFLYFLAAVANVKQ